MGTVAELGVVMKFDTRTLTQRTALTAYLMRLKSLAVAVGVLTVLASCEAQPLEDADKLDLEITTAVGLGSDGKIISVSDDLSCDFMQLDVCRKSGCQSSEPKIFVRWNASENIYSRCTKDGCDDYAVNPTQSGIFTNLAFANQSASAKIDSNGDILDIATLMGVVFINRGICRAN